MVSLTVCSLIIWLCAQDAAGRPHSLVALLEQRRSLVGDINWSVTLPDEPSRPMRFVSRFALNGDMIFEIRGDPNGWTVFTPQGKPRSRFPQLYLATADELWYFQETGGGASLFKRGGPPTAHVDKVKDIRRLGLLPWSKPLDCSEDFDAFWALGSPQTTPRWTERRVGEHILVRADMGNGRSLNWRLNPQKGGNLEEVWEEQDGSTVRRAVTTLGNVSGQWFPIRVDYMAGDRTTESVSIQQANLDPGSAVQQFTPNDIGLEPGSSVAPNDREEGAIGSLVWTGDGIITSDQFFREEKEGKRKAGPILERVRRLGYFDSPYLTEEERERRGLDRKLLRQTVETDRYKTLWAEYVRGFIARHQFNGEQATKAWQIHAQCLNRADEYVDRRRADFQSVLNDLEAARQKNDREQIQVQQERLAALQKPIDEIFSQQLKPRLEKLPTRAQRKAAEEAGAPANTPDTP